MPPNPIQRLADLDAEIEKLTGLADECTEYLEKELKTALEKEGNDQKVSRLFKGVRDRCREKIELASRIRIAGVAGLAPSAAGGPKDFGSLMAAERAS